MLRRSARAIVSLALWGAPRALPAQLAVISDAVQEREAMPNDAYDGTILIRNTGAETQEARLYQTDYRFYADGRSFYDPAGTLPRSNAGWVVVSPSRVVVPAGQTVAVHYRVAVPNAAGDSLRGTYWSMIMAEAVPPAAPPGAPTRRAIEVQATVRYGVQVVTHIGGTGAPDVRFAAPAANTAADGGRSLAVDLTNAGDRAHRIQVTLELYAADGRQIATLRQARGLVYPGSSIRQQFALGALPAGAYKALVVAEAGEDVAAGAQYTLHF